MKTQNTYSAVILAAGNSSRIGKPKFTLSFNDNETFLEHIIKGYEEFGCTKIVLVLNAKGLNILNKSFPHLNQRVEVIVNKSPELGRFLSLKLGLENCKKGSPAFIHNVDNPFINNILLNGLSENLKESDFTYPIYNGNGGHPLLVSKKLVSRIIDEPSDDIILSTFLKNYKSLPLPFNDERILLNINTKVVYNEFIKNQNKAKWEN